MLENKKHAFWQAFLISVLIFVLGLVFGIYVEQIRADKFDTLFYRSEVSLYDSFTLERLFNDDSISCENLRESNIEFADRIYIEAQQLEKFDAANKITESVRETHRKYDLLRTILWMNSVSVKGKCGGFDTVVYLYEYNTQDVDKKSSQIVWSRVLNDLKNELGNEIVLIPIAVDQDISSLEFMIRDYDIKSFPAVIINEKIVFDEHKTVEELGEVLED